MGLRRRTSRSRKIATRDLTSFLSKLKGKRCHGEWTGRSTQSRSGLLIGTWTMTNGNAGRGLKGGEYIFSGCQPEGLNLTERKLEKLVGGSDGNGTLRIRTWRITAGRPGFVDPAYATSACDGPGPEERITCKHKLFS